jgi:hypothetical protein
MALLEEVGWAATRNPDHDLGTDLWVQPRDERRFDLGLMLGFQVKNGDSFVADEVTVGEIKGRWLPESREHLKSWLAHAVPHIVVLRDPGTHTSYWAHVTKESVQWTGKGGKVFVPSHQVLGRDALPALTAIAAAMRPRPMWSGSAWTGAPDLLPSDELRYAMLAPRLIAPHPNRGPRSVEAHEALALLASGRFGELDRYGLNEPGGTGWRWSFYRAVLDLAETLEIEPLRTCAAAAKDPADVAASTAALAAALVEHGDVDGALAAIDDVLARDICEPVDQSWLHVHRARCLSEIGRGDEAVPDAVAVQALPQLHPNDVTAAFLAGAAAGLIFRSTLGGGADVASAISAGDSEATWWLAQTMSWGLGFAVDDAYRSWIANTSSFYASRESAAGRLRGASLVAGFGALHGHWGHAVAALAKSAFVSSHLDTETATMHLAFLQRSGNAQAVSGAVDRLLIDGPADAVTAAAAQVDVTRLTVTDAASSLELFDRGSDVLTTATADSLLEWSTSSATERDRWTTRTGSTVAPGRRLALLIRSCMPAASPSTVRLVQDHLLALDVMADQADANAWSQAVESVPLTAWTPTDVRQLLDRTGDNWELSDAIQRVGSALDEPTRNTVMDELRQGHTRALWRIRTLNELDSDTVSPLIASLSAEVRARQHDIKSGKVAAGRLTEAERLLTSLNVMHPDAANWDAVVEVLEAPFSIGDDLHRILRVLEADGDALPSNTKARLAAAVERVLARSFTVSFFQSVDPRTTALATLRVLSPNAHGIDLSAAGRDRLSRQTLTLSIARRRVPADFDTLAVLASDSNAHVRATVAGVLTCWTEEDIHPNAARTVEWLLDQDPGVLVARAIATNLPDVASAQTLPFVERLADHRSAQARNTARRLRPATGKHPG